MRFEKADNKVLNTLFFEKHSLKHGRHRRIGHERYEPSSTANTPRLPPGTSDKYLYRNCRGGFLQATTFILNNDTPALNALKALRGAPTSMGRVVKFPVELQAGSRPFLSYRFLDKYFDERGVAYG